MHCNLRPPEPGEPRQSFLALITTPCQVWSRWTYPILPYYSAFAADTWLYVVALTFHFTPWIFAEYRLWRDETLYQIWMQLNNPQWSYCDFSVWPYDLEHCVTCCARLWDNFHKDWPSTTYPCLNYSAFWCWYVMSLCGIDLWPLDLELSQHFGFHASTLCTKFERNRIIHGWVINDLARFRRAILGVGYFYRAVLRGAWTQLYQTWRGHRAIIPAQEDCLKVRISCCFFKRRRLKL